VAVSFGAKEEPNDFDAYYDNFGLDFDLLDRLFVEDIDSQQEVFGGQDLRSHTIDGGGGALRCANTPYIWRLCVSPSGELFPTIGYDRFLQTDKSGNPKGVVALDPRKLDS
jgi:hypothetical protein